MTDENRPEPNDEAPEQPSDDSPEARAEGLKPGGTPIPHVDLSNLKMFEEAANRISEQFAVFATAARRELDRAASVGAAAAARAAAGSQPWFTDLQRTLRERMDEDFAPTLGRILAQTQPQLTKLQRLVEDLRQLIPENLRGLRAGDHEKIFRLTGEDGTSLAWAPRVSIVRELLDADGLEARSTVLVDHAAEIADDVEASLASVALPQHQALRGLLLEAAAAVRAGLYGPAQAAASNVLDTTVNVHILEFLRREGPMTKTGTRKHFRPADDWGDITFAELELVLVGGGIGTAYEQWTRGEGHMSFNRHATAHQVDDGAYSPAHAIRALLLAQATLRWLDTTVAAEAATDEAA
ncbi:hypothetical protein ACF1AY_15905 [Streptomyces sp. NPDC014776]|uniref:hypothetical protein n=1 Tax=unclassified Streptomyces TaxID=2593676 RepID=UPI0036FF1E1C